VGYSRSTVDVVGAQQVFDGGGAALSFAIGGCLVENLALHADLFGVSAVGPRARFDGGTTIATSGRDASLTSVGVGIGMTYYVMPMNLYLGASIGVGRVAARDGNGEVQSDPGGALDFLVGKEWWVSPNWGIGIAGQVVIVRVPSRGDSDFITTGLGVLFSATYN
jgi:hypothetical protein